MRTHPTLRRMISKHHESRLQTKHATPPMARFPRLVSAQARRRWRLRRELPPTMPTVPATMERVAPAVLVVREEPVAPAAREVRIDDHARTSGRLTERKYS